MVCLLRCTKQLSLLTKDTLVVRNERQDLKTDRTWKFVNSTLQEICKYRIHFLEGHFVIRLITRILYMTIIDRVQHVKACMVIARHYNLKTP
jgi:hypothetical protein